jgi:hypothetical protein
MNWTEIFQKGCNSFIDWGPGMLLAALVLYGLYRLMHQIGLKVVAALEKPTDALSQQAASMDRLTVSIKDYVGRDTNEHQEIIILQKVIRQELKETRENLTDMRKQTEENLTGMRKQTDRIEKYFEESRHG